MCGASFSSCCDKMSEQSHFKKKEGFLSLPSSPQSLIEGKAPCLEHRPAGHSACAVRVPLDGGSQRGTEACLLGDLGLSLQEHITRDLQGPPYLLTAPPTGLSKSFRPALNSELPASGATSTLPQRLCLRCFSGLV